MISLFLQHLLFISDAHLKAICEAYGQFSKKDIEVAIKSETSGNLCRSLLAIGKCRRRSKSEFYISFSPSDAQSTWIFRLSIEESTEGTSHAS